MLLGKKTLLPLHCRARKILTYSYTSRVDGSKPGGFTIFMDKHILEIREFCRAIKLDKDITDVAKA